MPTTRRKRQRHLRRPSGLESEVEGFLREGSEGLSNRFFQFEFLHVGEDHEETDWIRAAWEVWSRQGQHYWNQPNPPQHIVYMHNAYGEPWKATQAEPPSHQVAQALET